MSVGARHRQRGAGRFFCPRGFHRNTLVRSARSPARSWSHRLREAAAGSTNFLPTRTQMRKASPSASGAAYDKKRSEEHTSELQSRQYLVCRLLLEKKKRNKRHNVQHSNNRRQRREH